MKKLLLIVGLVLGLVSVSQAQLQRHVVQSFINATSITVSNGLSVTNLQSLLTQGSVGPGTNIWGITFTNYSGVAVMVTNNAAVTNTIFTYENYNLLGAAHLWENATHVVQALANSTNGPTYNSVMIKLIGQSGANAAVNFTFVPLPDGTNEVTASGDTWVVGVTANTTTPVCIFTNIPARFIGCAKLRLRSVLNTDTDATSKVDILSCGLVGFPPVNQ